MKVPVVEFKGDEYILISDSPVLKKAHGAMTTPELFRHGKMSYAHLGEDGVIRRFHTEIGTREDLRLLRLMETPKPDADAWDNLAEWA